MSEQLYLRADYTDGVFPNQYTITFEDLSAVEREVVVERRWATPLDETSALVRLVGPRTIREPHYARVGLMNAFAHQITYHRVSPEQVLTEQEYLEETTIFS